MADLKSPLVRDRRAPSGAAALELPVPADTSIGAEIDRIVSKCIVIGLSLTAITWIVGDAAVVYFLLLVAASTFAAIAVGDRFVQQSSWRIASAVIFGAVLFGTLLAFNVAGLVGNLTGNPESESLRNQWPLTIGIGFYTLQIIGVAIDVMRRKIALPSPLDYLFYILYLPKFLSGPIEQGPFLERVRTFRLRYADENMATGLPWLVLGIFMKFAIADSVSRLVDINYVQPLGLVVTTAFYELRVYFDWAGYSLMAYGLAWCFGLPVMLNFAQPLFAHNPQELWRRWHISLGRWLHEYLYLPLIRGIPYPVLLSFLAPIAVFLLSAMWHGVSFNFLLWGIFHAGAYLLFVKVLRHVRTPRILGILAFVMLLLIGRLLFMDDDTARLLTKLANLTSLDAWRADLTADAVRAFVTHVVAMPQTKTGLFGVVAAVCFIFFEWVNERRHSDKPYHLFLRPWVTIMLAIATLFLACSTNIGFVYARY